MRSNTHNNYSDEKTGCSVNVHQPLDHHPSSTMSHPDHPYSSPLPPHFPSLSQSVTPLKTYACLFPSLKTDPSTSLMILSSPPPKSSPFYMPTCRYQEHEFPLRPCRWHSTSTFLPEHFYDSFSHGIVSDPSPPHVSSSDQCPEEPDALPANNKFTTEGQEPSLHPQSPQQNQQRRWWL